MEDPFSRVLWAVLWPAGGHADRNARAFWVT
jgi:hypothetical protein